MDNFKLFTLIFSWGVVQCLKFVVIILTIVLLISVQNHDFD